MRPRNPTEDEYSILLANITQVRGTGSTDARRTTGNGSSCEAAIQQTKSRRGESAPSPLSFTLAGQLVSGKNQVQLLFRNGKVHKYPNKTFTNWRATSHVQIMGQLDLSRVTLLIRPVHLTVAYTPGDLRTRDVSGQLDALFHLLVYAKVLKDDGLIYDVTWRRQPMNRKAPGVQVTLEEVR